MNDETINQENAQKIVALLHDAQRINAKLQGEQRTGSTEWHEHETLDDRLHAALELLGD